MMKLIHGNCIEKMREIPDGSVDAIITDPPYIGMVNQTWDRINKKDADVLFNNLFEESHRVLRYGGRFVCFSSEDTLSYLYRHNNLLNRELLVIEKDVKKVSVISFLYKTV